ncbi:hypothetical protein KSB_53790 [Ktedonobacter robiniae]|uniref:Uncharacterized protein n=1 Tax=Ktedonobacter robiniae TaxID=2778365 RepID=A0ABQ3UW52_9CHLR|nr:hypothetical protein KSB_53790 [Ktedonobacter robiniae]
MALGRGKPGPYRSLKPLDTFSRSETCPDKILVSAQAREVTCPSGSIIAYIHDKTMTKKGAKVHAAVIQAEYTMATTKDGI